MFERRATVKIVIAVFDGEASFKNELETAFSNAAMDGEIGDVYFVSEAMGLEAGDAPTCLDFVAGGRRFQVYVAPAGGDGAGR